MSKFEQHLRKTTLAFKAEEEEEGGLSSEDEEEDEELEDEAEYAEEEEEDGGGQDDVAATAATQEAPQPQPQPSKFLSASRRPAATTTTPPKRQRLGPPSPTSAPTAPPHRPPSAIARSAPPPHARPPPAPPRPRPQPLPDVGTAAHEQRSRVPPVPQGRSVLDLSRDPRLTPEQQRLAALVQRSQPPTGPLPAPPPSSSGVPMRPYMAPPWPWLQQQPTPLPGVWQPHGAGQPQYTAVSADPRLRQVVKTEPQDEAEAEMRTRAELVVLEEKHCCHLFLDGVDPRDVEGMERLATLCRQYGGDNDSPATLIGPWHQFFNSGSGVSASGKFKGEWSIVCCKSTAHATQVKEVVQESAGALQCAAGLSARRSQARSSRPIRLQAGDRRAVAWCRPGPPRGDGPRRRQPTTERPKKKRKRRREEEGGRARGAADLRVAGGSRPRARRTWRHQALRRPHGARQLLSSSSARWLLRFLSRFEERASLLRGRRTFTGRCRWVARSERPRCALGCSARGRLDGLHRRRPHANLQASHA